MSEDLKISQITSEWPPGWKKALRDHIVSHDIQSCIEKSMQATTYHLGCNSCGWKFGISANFVPESMIWKELFRLFVQVPVKCSDAADLRAVYDVHES
jgi:hypothetical protein